MAKLCLSIAAFLSLIAERPAKCRPTSPLHSEGIDVGGLTGVSVIVGWKDLPEFELEKELKKAVGEKKKAPLSPLEVEPFLAALEALLDKVELGLDELTTESWRKRYYQKICDDVGSPEAALREVHEEEDDEEGSEREFERTTEAACALAPAAFLVAKGKAAVSDFVVFSDRYYGSEENSHGVREVYLGAQVSCGTAEEFAKAVTVAAKRLEKFAEAIGRSGPPSVHVDGDYEQGNCYDEY